MYKIGLSTKGNKDLGGAEFFRACRDSGIDVIELACGCARLADYDYKGLKRLSDEYGVGLWSFHLPYDSFSLGALDISSPDSDIRMGTLGLFDGFMEKAADIGIKTFVVHPSMEPVAAEERRERIKCSQESLVYLADKAERLGVRIAAEDLPRTCLGNTISELTEIISVDDRLGICFDTNHLLTDNDLDFIKALGGRIATMHVSDYDRVNERHWLPGEGTVDWTAVYKGMVGAGYSGPWLYEIAFETPASVARGRDLKCEDFVRNAVEIMEGRTLTVISEEKKHSSQA